MACKLTVKNGAVGRVQLYGQHLLFFNKPKKQAGRKTGRLFQEK
jgi:hypothetical protein